MNNQELLHAFGKLDEELLAQADKTPKKKRSVWLRIGAAAAIAAALAGTCFAVSAIVNRITEAQATRSRISAVIVNNNAESSSIGASWIFAESTLDLKLTIDRNETAPQTIETYYAPTAMQHGWTASQMSVNIKNWKPSGYDTHLSWDDSVKQYVEFTQEVIQFYNTDEITKVAGTGFDAEYALDTVTLGGQTYQRLTVEPSRAESKDGVLATDAGMRKYFWSDGDYLFTLTTTRDMADAQTEKILKSVAPVDDIMDYMDVVYEFPVAGDKVPPLGNLWQLKRVPLDYREVSNQCEDSSSYFQWNKVSAGKQPTTLCLAQLSTDPCWSMQWLTSPNPYTQQVLTIAGQEVTIFSSEATTEALWHNDDGWFSLRSDGPERMSVEQLAELVTAIKK